MKANNNQKMREVLKEAQKRLEQMVGCDMHRYYREAQTCDGQTTTGDCVKMATCKVIFQIRSALAASPRNCDVGTAEEQEERFKNFCQSYYEPCNVDGECWKCPLFKTKTSCPIAWAQMPYEGGAE